MNYQALEDHVKAGYRDITEQYRRDDEIEVQTENHRRLGPLLKGICRTFPHPILALEVGCGTGRYFHCLTNVEKLVGIDISADMLRHAEHPVRADQITTKNIELIVGNAYLNQFPHESFHFIYSLGMFGHGCPVTKEICDSFYSWLKPGGILLFNTVDYYGLRFDYRVRRRVKSAVYPWLTSRMRKRLDDRQNRSPFFCLTVEQLRAKLLETQFKDFSITSHRCKSPLWNGRHLECLAVKR